MTTDLWMLVAAVLWCMTQLLFIVYGRARTPGAVEWGVGARDEPFQAPAWVGRAERAHANMVENLPLFAALVLVAHVSGEASSRTALACQVFVGARVAHTLLYLAGVNWWRTHAFGLSLLALLGIVYELAT